MKSTGMGSKRRRDALTHERIVTTAIAILDAQGEQALTFRALAERLETGSGAIYWHVRDKQTLLADAADLIIAAAWNEVDTAPHPQTAIRRIALGVFDAILARPWLGGQLAANPWQYAVLRILEAIGRQIQALGVPHEAQFNTATALISFILGLAGQFAAGVRLCTEPGDRTMFLKNVAAQWNELAPDLHPFVTGLASELPQHDDREQFLAGVNLILSGIEAQVPNHSESM
ncbi:TetR family transcriptional regulator (plasmid) [Novosphingobium sp. BL-8A]|uniref:TetR/AcrR family transcriptional regulator n=1 Tax=Novosphingobium sp. BL-8A TaxID=3127639 RepID=UPI0037582E98